MIKVLINGINGQMGQALQRVSKQHQEKILIVCGVDPAPGRCDVPVYPSFDDVDTDFDLVVDFSIPSACMTALSYCRIHRKPIIICTTGLSESDLEHVRDASHEIPVFMSSNMSIGVCLLRSLCATARAALGEDFDVELIETHHNKKIDAPSGTAKTLLETIETASPNAVTPVYGRCHTNHRREKTEIGVHSIRGGTVAGIHEVLFLGEDESVSLKHQAYSKNVFANGAFRAVLFLSDRDPGLYDMNDLMQSLL